MKVRVCGEVGTTYETDCPNGTNRKRSDNDMKNVQKSSENLHTH
jgi:hypothetical protein